jgi:hypothetical protein
MTGREKTAVQPGSDDSTLTVDDLVEYFPRPLDPDSLAVTGLRELFPERKLEAEEGEDGEEGGGSWGVHRRDVTPTITSSQADAEERLGLEIFGSTSFAPAQIVLAEEVFESQIRRTAIEFQRFAEEFHAFAVECDQR